MCYYKALVWGNKASPTTPPVPFKESNMSATFILDLTTSPTDTVVVRINGRRVELRLIEDTLIVDGDNRLWINTGMRSAKFDQELLQSDISILGLSKKTEQRLRLKGIDLIGQLVWFSRDILFGHNPNPSRRRWLDEVDEALAKKGLLLGMNIPCQWPPRASPSQKEPRTSTGFNFFKNKSSPTSHFPPLTSRFQS